MAKPLTESEFFWLIGILEGEGCFTFHRTTQRVSLCMSDKDVMLKAASIFTKITDKEFKLDNGRVSLDKQISLGRKEVFTLEAYGESARTICRTIVPHMSQRRRQRIWQVLNGYKYKQENLNIDNVIQLCLGK